MVEECKLSLVGAGLQRVKFGLDYAEEVGKWVVVPEDKGAINVTWFMYELIALAIPMKHVHAPGECNGAMDSELHKYLRVSPDDEEDGYAAEDDVDGGDESVDKPIDPRWNELRKILDNN